VIRYIVRNKATSPNQSSGKVVLRGSIESCVS
jgi:hypothetical protein